VTLINKRITMSIREREIYLCALSQTCRDGFLLGTREALYGNDRQSMTITAPRVDARTVGALIALFERAVGLYASLITSMRITSPAVEAGKKAAAAVLNLQAKILAALSNSPQTPEQVASAIGAVQSVETVFLVLEHLAANGRAKISRAAESASTTFTPRLNGGRSSPRSSRRAPRVKTPPLKRRATAHDSPQPGIRDGCLEWESARRPYSSALRAILDVIPRIS